MEELPSEILLNIFKKLKNNRLEIMLVQKSWMNLLKSPSCNCFNKGKDILKTTILQNHIDCFLFALDFIPFQETKFICEYCGISNALEILKIARNKGYFWGEVLYINCVAHGRYEMLKWIVENNCPLGSLCDTSHLIDIAAEYGYIEILKYLVENNISVIEDSTGESASHGGFIDILEYLKDKVEWTEKCCAYACDKGNLNTLIWLHNINCPWDSSACSYASQSGSLECLTYLCENGCPMDNMAMYLAQESNNQDIINYLISQGLKPKPSFPNEPVNTPTETNPYNIA